MYFSETSGVACHHTQHYKMKYRRNLQRHDCQNSFEVFLVRNPSLTHCLDERLHDPTLALIFSSNCNSSFFFSKGTLQFDRQNINDMVLLNPTENFKGRMFKGNESGSVLSSFHFLASKSFSNPKTFSPLRKKVIQWFFWIKSYIIWRISN